MNSKRISVSLLFMTVVTLLVVLALHVRIGATADSIAVLKTTGMTCSSCSGKITRVLESLKGVAVTEIDVEKGWVIVGYDKKDVKPESLAAEVTDTGFVSSVQAVLTPEQFRQETGRDIGRIAASKSGCCGSRGGGCGGNKPQGD